MHNDGVVYFPIEGSRRGLIVQNHEYTDDGLLFPDGVAELERREDRASRRPPTACRSSRSSSVIGGWRVRRPSRYARRITAYTPIDLAGPAAGHALLQTGADPTGTAGAGHAQQLRHGLHAVGYVPGVRGELQRVLPEDDAHGPLETRYGIGATSTVPLVHDRHPLRPRCRAQ